VSGFPDVRVTPSLPSPLKGGRELKAVSVFF
jgi:hypothetical protein